jgi:ubiquitin fusion degradation protein 1
LSFSTKFLIIRLDGKIRKVKNEELPPIIKASYQRGVPDFDYQFGNLKFIRAVKKEDEKEKETLESTFEAFSGAGQSLRQTKFIN